MSFLEINFMRQMIDPIKLSSDLIKIKSITPDADVSIDLLISILEPLGFNCQKLVFGENIDRVENLYARLGKNSPNLCFAGHVDVVPPGNENDWSFNPFSGEIKDEMILGRGSVDMKSSIAAFISAISSCLNKNPNIIEQGSLSFLITGDEEGKAINGTKKVVEWLKKNDEKIDACVVGEPTNPNKLGEMIKIGRRGSYSGELIVYGVQGHVGYPHLAENPINSLFKMIEPLLNVNLDQGNDLFEPSTAMITSIDVKNDSFNIIPSKAVLKFNVRFNNLFTSDSLTKKFKSHFDSLGFKYNFDYFCNAEPFLTNSGHLINCMEEAIKKITNKIPEKSTTGGTSDARFIKEICPVIEFGLVGKLMHKIDEKVSVKEIMELKQVYYEFLKLFFIK